MNNQLSEQIVKRIRQEAERFAFLVPYDGSNTFAYEDAYRNYIAGATTWATNAMILLEALEKICNPIKSMQDALKEGERLDGHMAIMLSSDAVFLKDIARQAIASYNNNKP